MICASLLVIGCITIIILERNKIYTPDINSFWIVVIPILVVLFCFYLNKSSYKYRLVWKIINEDYEKYEFLCFSLDTKEFVDEYLKHSSFLIPFTDNIFNQCIISNQDYGVLKNFSEGTIVGITLKPNECTFSVANPSIINDITLSVEYKKSIEHNQKDIITIDLDRKEIIYYYRDEIHFNTFFDLQNKEDINENA